MEKIPSKLIPWDKEVNFAVTVCDPEGIILQMNDKSKNTFQKGNNGDLIGTNVLECHPPAAKNKLIDLLKHHETNAYTIEKNGQKKLIYQTPWYEAGKFCGFVELSMVIPMDMAHRVRRN